jgi:hypothetical protein
MRCLASISGAALAIAQKNILMLVNFGLTGEA